MASKKKKGRRKPDWKKVRAKGALDIETVFTIYRNKPVERPGLRQSKRETKCNACGGIIEKDEWVSKSRIAGVVHPKCIGKDNEQYASRD